VLGFLFADAGDPDREGWRGKASFLTMQNTPGLAREQSVYDPTSKRLALMYDGVEVAAGDVSSDADRELMTR
jgi:hypothetical protein